MWGVVVLRGNCTTNEGSCPGGRFPERIIAVEGNWHTGSCPRGNFPTGSCPRGYCPKG